MLGVKENRDRLIKRAIENIKITSLTETETENFEYEPSEIIRALFESTDNVDSPEPGFKNRKLKKKKKIDAFFSNSESYIKKKNKDV